MAGMLSGWLALLSRLTGSTSVAVGTSCDGRTYDELADAMGPLARYLPVTADQPGETPFAELAARVHVSMDDVPQWQEYFSWDQLPGANGADTPFFPFGFDFEEPAEVHQTAGVSFSIYRQYTPLIQPMSAKSLLSSAPKSISGSPLGALVTNLTAVRIRSG